MLNIVASNQFKKDLKLAAKCGLKIEKLRDVVDTLARQEVTRLCFNQDENFITKIL